MRATLLRKTASTLAVLSLGLTLGVAGCSKSTQPPAPPSAPPTPDSPVNAMALLKWSWEHRDTLHYAMLPAANFWFGWTISDTVTNPLGNSPWTRDQELGFARHLFSGGAPSGEPPASGIAFSFQSQPIPTADSRIGRDPGWHQEVTAQLDVQVNRTDNSTWLIGAPVCFFLVRGDSAILPPGLPASPDRWYLEGWNELNLTPNTQSKFNTFIPLRDRYR